MPVYNTGDPRVDQAFGNLASIFAPDPRREIAVRQSIADMHYKNAQRHKLEQEMLFENYLLGRRQKIGDQFGQALQAQYGNLSPDMAAVLAGTLGVRDGNVDQTATGIGTLSSIAALLGGGQGEDAQRRAMALRGQMADNNTRMTTGYDQKVRGDDRSHDWRKHGATISATNARHAQLMQNNLEVQRLKDEQARWETLNSPQKLGQGDTVMFPGGQHEPYTSPVPLLHNADPGDATLAVDGNGVRTVREADPAAAAAAAGKSAPGPNSLAGYADRLGIDLMPGTSADAMDNNVLMVYSELRRRGEPIPPALENQARLSAHRMKGGGLTMVDNGDGTRTLYQTQGSLPPGFAPEEAAGTAEAPPVESGLTGPEEVVEDHPGGQPVPRVQTGPITEFARDQTDRGAGPLRAGDTIGTVRQTKIPQEALRGIRLDTAMTRSAAELFELFKFDPSTGELAPDGHRPGFMSWLGDKLLDPDTKVLLNPDADSEKYDRVRFSTVEPLLRLRSGAATPDPEIIRYYSNLVPIAGNEEEEVQARLIALHAELQAAQAMAQRYGVDLGQLASLPPEVRDKMALEFNSTVPADGRYKTDTLQPWMRPHLQKLTGGQVSGSGQAPGWGQAQQAQQAQQPAPSPAQADNVVQRARQVLEALRQRQ